MPLGLVRHVLKYGVIALILLVFYSDTVVSTEASPHIYSSVQDIPYRRVGVLLGTSPYLSGGRLNSYFWNRVDAAAELFRNGKVSYILASGDNRHHSYNEPQAMREALTERGVPAHVIYLDHAGFSTLDSVLRTRKVFLQESFTVVSQRFHVERAIYIANHHGIQAIGYDARDVSGSAAVRTRFREYFARVKAVMDVHVLQRSPEYLGDQIIIR